jgi:hypothetical protein
MLVSNIATLTKNDSENEQIAAVVCFVIEVTGRLVITRNYHQHPHVWGYNYSAGQFSDR